MNESIYGNLKLGIVHFKAFPECVNGEGPIVETVQKICEDGFFTAIEIGKVGDPLLRSRVRRLTEIAQIEVVYACQPTVFPGKLNLSHTDPAERKKAVKAIFNCLKQAYDMGATAVRIPSGKYLGDASKEESMKCLADSFSQICERAKEMGDPLVTLKVFDRSIDKEALIGPCQDALAISQMLRPSYPRFALLTDLSHFPLLGEKPEETLPVLKDYVAAFHIGNCVFNNKLDLVYGDLQPRFGYPNGEVGIADVANYFRVLKKLGLIGPDKMPVLSGEVRPLAEGETSELIIANFKRTVNQAWALA